MTPEEFRDRATVATEPLQPGPVSYEWLRASIDRRRRRTRLLNVATAAACVAVAGVAFATIPGRDGGTKPLAPPPSAARGPRPAAMDVDADGKADDVFVLDEADRWGVEVRGTTWGRVELWMDDPEVGTTGRGVNGTMHMDDEPGAETLVGISEGDIDQRDFLLVVPVDGKPVWLTDERGRLVRLRDTDDHATTFECLTLADGGRRVVLIGPGPQGPEREVYRIVRGVLTRDAGVVPADRPLESCYLG